MATRIPAYFDSATNKVVPMPAGDTIDQSLIPIPTAFTSYYALAFITANYSLAPNTWKVVNGLTISSSNNITTNAANGTFTAPVAGLYTVSAIVCRAANTSTWGEAVMDMDVLVNGAAVYSRSEDGSTSAQDFRSNFGVFSMPIMLAANDVVSFRHRVSINGQTKNFLGGAVNTRVSMIKI